jgi:molybdate transport system substrate-binding protein
MLRKNLPWKPQNMPKRLFAYFLFFVASVGLITPATADEIQVAVASNFASPIKHLAQKFEETTGHKVTLVFGATGRHYAQIINGAPFDAYFAADQKRPQRLEKSGLTQPQSRFTYAIGKLVLWSPRSDFIDPQGNILQSGKFTHLAIANPALAPYGRAARQVLEKRHNWQRLLPRIVRGENIGQAFQFVKSGNAQLGFVALSQIKNANGSLWQPPQNSYDQIEQQAVQLRPNPVARAFLAFIKSADGRAIIKSFGYGVPDA